MLGSCFSEDIGFQFKQALFKTHINPFGVLYNPHSLSIALRRCLIGTRYTADDLVSKGDLFHTWDHHGVFSDVDEEKALDRINTAILHTHNFLKQPKLHLFITFASMRVYTLDGRIVANCHKYPGNSFERRLLDVDEVEQDWNTLLLDLKKTNPEIRVWFTVSPVRHIRDGLIQNQRSKARTLELVHRLCDANDHCEYFPSFEILLDELRDYRFFESDMVHPNQLAIAYIWSRLTETLCDSESIEFLIEWAKLQNILSHRILHHGTQEQQRFEQMKHSEIEKFEQKYQVNVPIS